MRITATVSRALFAASLVACGGALLAASPEWETPAVSHKDVKPYFDDLALRDVSLPPPPAEGSAIDLDDIAGVMRRQEVSPERRAVAEADAEYLYDRFADALGVPIRRATTPMLVAMLNRAERQVSGPVFALKKIQARARPYQRMSLAHVCGRDGPSNPDPDAAKRTSYPSGHSAYGWVAALILARVAPERAPAILQRGMDYGESRVICGMHFPSDVAAGQLMAAAVVAHLDRVPGFQHDLRRARAEVARLRSGK